MFGNVASASLRVDTGAFAEPKPELDWVLEEITRSEMQWCPEEDSNLHASRRQYLKLVRLPIPPSGLSGMSSRDAAPSCQLDAGALELARGHMGGAGRPRDSGKS